MDIISVLTELAKRHKHRKFIYQGQEVPKEKLFDPKGCLSILTRKANMLSDFLFGEKLAVALVSDPTSMTGERVDITKQQKPFVFVMMLYDTLEELVANAGSGDVILN
jgi:hypothetical protein